MNRGRCELFSFPGNRAFQKLKSSHRPLLPALATVMLIGVLCQWPAAVRAEEPDFARLFAGRDGCFELYDMMAGKLVVRSDALRCSERMSPCSTFKLALALMAFDSGVLADERSGMKWDGKDYGRAPWNRDQTAASWMQDSVVWFSQRLAPRLGMKRVQGYLKRFAYGDQDMSGGLTRAWLDSSLAISPDEQLRFLQRLFRGELPVSRHALRATRKIALAGTSAAGWTLHGKTGSGYLGPDEQGKARARLHGWFVGHVARGERAYVFVTAYADREPPADERPAGWIARDITKAVLGTLGLY
jgi:beta-lactamase class D